MITTTKQTFSSPDGKKKEPSVSSLRAETSPGYQRYLEHTALSASRCEGGEVILMVALWKSWLLQSLYTMGMRCRVVWVLCSVFFFFHISQQSLRGEGDNPGSVQGTLPAVPIMLVLLTGLKNFYYVHLCFTAWLNQVLCASTIVTVQRCAKINESRNKRKLRAK